MEKKKPSKRVKNHDKFESLRAKKSLVGMDFMRTFTARDVQPKKLIFRQVCSSLFLWMLTAFLVIYLLIFSSYEGIDKWDQLAYAGMMCFMFQLFIILDAYDKFHEFHSFLENMFSGRGQTILSVMFMILGFIDYIMIEVHYSMLNENGPMALFVTLYVVYYISLILLFLTWMAYWEVFAFYCAEYSYMHGFLYISMFGGVVLFIARWIRPSHEGDWHHHPGTNVVLNGILNVISGFFVFLVLLAGMGIPLFSEFGRNANKMGMPLAFTLLAILSMIVMLTPLAPGNIVDVCGGFVILQILQKSIGFWGAWIIAYFSVCVLHFSGACAQWFIGKQPCVQAWGNSTLPIPMLAASDAVLKEANCFRVGLIGYVFMDTANGLNQGRINMEFWTQLLSEWTCFLNALPLVSLGAAVAVSGDKSLEWTRLALPVLLLLATCWQLLGTSFGAKAMGSSTDTEEYWQSREKWNLTQLFTQTGYIATQLGWENDVYQLVRCNQEIYQEDGNEECLYAKMVKVHKLYLRERNALQTEAARIERYQEYNDEVSMIREWHTLNLNRVLEAAVNAEWLIYKAPKKTKEGWFEKKENITYKKVVIGLLVVCYWVSIIGIWNKIYMKDAVSQGLKVLENITIWAWAGFFMFIVLELVYYHVQIFSGLKSLGSTYGWLYGGCKFNHAIETKFDTPKWEKQ